MIDKKLFQSKLVYWITAIFFTVYALFSIVKFIFQLGFGDSYFLIPLAILAILSIVTAVLVFEKHNKSIILINIFFCLFIPFSLWDSITIYETHYIYEPEVL